MNIVKFVVIGHVDTGKSTLAGHLLYKMGYVSKHEMQVIIDQAEKDKMAKWCWARVLDCYDEERRRGKTHERDIVEFTDPDSLKKYVMIDTPGHLDFVRQMIAGLNDVQVAVLLISANMNEFLASFERGMLKEHLILAKAKGIRNLIVVVNKMDTIDWSEEGYRQIIGLLQPFLKYINWTKSVQFVPVSAWDGIGLTDDSLEKIPSWAPKLSLIGALNKIDITHIETAPIEESTEADVLLVKFRVISTDIPITMGYRAVFHYDDKEISGVITAIKDAKFLLSDTVATVVVTLDNRINCYRGQRLIIRKDTSTVGFGTIEGRKTT